MKRLKNSKKTPTAAKKAVVKRGRPTRKDMKVDRKTASNKNKTTSKNTAIKRSRSPKKIVSTDSVTKTTTSRKRKASKSNSGSEAKKEKLVRVSTKPMPTSNANKITEKNAKPKSILKTRKNPLKLSKQNTIDMNTLSDGPPGELLVKRSIDKAASLTKTDSKPYISKSGSIPKSMFGHTLLEIPLPGGQFSSGFGLHVDEDRILFGDEEGSIIELDHKGNVIKRSKLDQGVRCIVKDGGFIYAGGNDGGLYDLTSNEPRLMCRIEDFGKVYCLDVKHGIISASDENGYVALVNYEGEIMWKKLGATDGWMVEMDDDFIYHGTIGSVEKMEKMTGDEIWKQESLAPVNYGTRKDDKILVAITNRVIQVDSETGKTLNEYKNKDSDTIYCCDKGDGLVFAGSDNCVLVYQEDSEKLLYNLKVNHRPYSIKYYRGRLYLIGKSLFTILSLTKDSIESMLERGGKSKFVPKRIENIFVDVPLVAPLTRVESINTVRARGGIIVECVKDGDRLRVKPVTPLKPEEEGKLTLVKFLTNNKLFFV